MVRRPSDAWELLEFRRHFSAAPAIAPVPFALDVTAGSDIYDAGLQVPLDSAQGTAPPSISFAAHAHERFTFTSVTGSVNYGVADSNGPNGDQGDPANGQQSSDFLPVGSLSGFHEFSNFYPLVGVFTKSGPPTGSPPPVLSYTRIPKALAINPRLNQVFFVGTGSAPSGKLRTYAVPAGATKLYLGFADRYFPDDIGTLHITASANVPPVHLQDIPTQTISAAPAMPAIPINLAVAEGFSIAGPINYAGSISYSAPGVPRESIRLQGTGDSNAFTVSAPAGIIRGGTFLIQLTVPIKSDLTGRISAWHLQGTAQIIGTNPSSTDVVSATAGNADLAAIAQTASGFQQFNSAGLPLIQKRGSGLTRLVGKAGAQGAEQAWDWRANLAAGGALFALKEITLTQHYATAARLADAPALDASQFSLAALQYYDGGFYWIWSKSQDAWIKNPSLGTRGIDPTFGEKAIAFANQVAG